MNTLSLSTALAERPFLKLKLINTRLRSTMEQERLSSLGILSIEHELSILMTLSMILQAEKLGKFTFMNNCLILAL